jgi:hypothetical protein
MSDPFSNAPEPLTAGDSGQPVTLGRDPRPGGAHAALLGPLLAPSGPNGRRFPIDGGSARTR